MAYTGGEGQVYDPNADARKAALARAMAAKRTASGYTGGEGQNIDPNAGARNTALMKALQEQAAAKELSAQPTPEQNAPQVDPNKAYDLQRAQISADEAEARKAANTQLQEQAAGAGFGEGSGVMEKMAQKQDIAMRMAEGRRLGGVDVAQAQAAASSAEAEKGRQFVATQADLDRELSREGLSLEEKRMAEQTRQFESQQDFTEYMTKMGYEQDAINRAWTSGEAAQDRAYRTSERLGTEEFTQKMTDFAQQYGIRMAEMQNMFSTNAADRQRAWEQQDIVDKARADSWFAMGRSGSGPGGNTLTVDEMNNLQKTDPVAFYAYQSGQSGRTQADYELGLENEQQARNALISTLDPQAPGTMEMLKQIYGNFITGTGTEGALAQSSAAQASGATMSRILASLMGNK